MAVPDRFSATRQIASPRPEYTRGDWLAFLGFASGCLLLMTCVMATIPDPSGNVALVYAPTLTAVDAFQRAADAGARPIRFGRFDWIIVVAPQPNDPGFGTRAHEGGALAVINPLLAGGCSARAAISVVHNPKASR
jgi:hypothetical protein